MHLVAHRGLPRQHPENSIRSLVASIEHADAVEFDVRRAACGTLVCSHDDSLARTTGHADRVSERTWEWIRAASPDVPRFADVVAALGSRTGMSVDLKSVGFGVEAQLVRELRDAGVGLKTAAKLRAGGLPAPGDAIIESGSLRALYRLGRAAPAVGRLLVVGGRMRPRSLALCAGALRTVCHGVALPNRLATRRQIRWLHRVGLRVFVYTVNDPRRYVELGAFGADAVFSDVSDSIRSEADPGTGAL